MASVEHARKGYRYSKAALSSRNGIIRICSAPGDLFQEGGIRSDHTPIAHKAKIVL